MTETIDIAIVTAIISAISGITGAVIGGIVPWIRESRVEKIKKNTDLKYLSIIVSSHLLRFSERCLDVSHDDGQLQGLPAGKDGIYETTTTTPEFKPLEIDVHWKVLPVTILSDILNIPEEQHAAQKIISDAWEIYGAPYDWAIAERQLQYAILGHKAITTLIELRKYAKTLDEFTARIANHLQDDLSKAIATLQKQKTEHEEGNHLPIP